MKCILLSLIVTTAAACGGSSKKSESTPLPPPPVEEAKPAEPAPLPEPPPPAPKEATATLTATPKSKSKVTGSITFKEVEGGVEVTANIQGLKAGDHGWHVHETGDCSAPDGASAGGHFNPDAHKHGGPETEMHHAGDFGNLTAGKDGKATATFTMKGISLGDEATSIAGRGFIVHAKKDDLKTDPSGNSGDRIACGVITVTP